MTPDPKPEPKQKKRPDGHWINGRFIASIKPATKKMQKGRVKYQRQRKHFLKENPHCQVNKCCDPGTIATTVHHKRGRLGKLLWDPKFFLAACVECHEYIEKHVKWARKIGFTLKRF